MSCLMTVTFGRNPIIIVAEKTSIFDSAPIMEDRRRSFLVCHSGSVLSKTTKMGEEVNAVSP